MSAPGAERAAAPEPAFRLWRNGDFVRLLASESISQIGSQVTTLALPLAAIITLNAAAGEVGVLRFAQYLPFLLVALPFGLLVDRQPRRRLMMVANLVQAVALLAVPLAQWRGLLRIEELYVVAFVVGAFAVLFQLSWQSYLPSIVSSEELAGANGALLASSYSIEIGGPGLGGLVVQLLTAPYALLLDAVSFLLATVGLATIRAAEPRPSARERNLRGEVVDGFRAVFGHPYVRPIAMEAATSNLFSQFVLVVFLIYGVRTLGLSPTVLGLVLGSASVGALIGALVTGRLTERLRFGWLLAGSMVVGCTFPLLLGLASGPTLVVMAVLFVGMAGHGVGIAVSSVLVVTLRQAATDPALLGRMNAVYRMFVTGTMSVGAALGGLAAQLTDPRTAILIGAAGLFLAPLWVLLSPVRSLAEAPKRA